MNASLRAGAWLSGLLALALIAPAQIRAWRYEAGEIRPAARNTAAPIAPPVASGDLDGDGQPESLTVLNGRAELHAGPALAWQSPPAWGVRQAALTDLDRDGHLEVTLLLMRPFEPWPIDRYLVHPGRIAGFHDAAGQSCHIILVGWAGGEYREVWAGSAMADPFLAFAAADLDADGRQELAALEGAYADAAGTPARGLTIWEWNGFGFSLLARRVGTFRQMAVAVAPDGALVITQQ
jgi:hypothetical protein